MKKVVALGGGTGLSTLLKGLKKYPIDITAIVTVSDSGGSSGRLRKEYGVLPPGDIRNCIVALAEEESLMTKLMNYRFEVQKELGEPTSTIQGKSASTKQSGLGGHSLGNLLLVALSEITGDFPEAIKEISQVLNVRGKVLPASTEQVHLIAETDNGLIVEGEVNIDLGTYKGKKKIKRVFLKPADISGYQESIRAIQQADAIIIGPGDLFTSIMPNLLIKDIEKNIKKSKAKKIYVCNVANKFTETDGFKVSDYLEKIKEHLGANIFNYILINNNYDVSIPKEEKHSRVEINKREVQSYVNKIIEADLVDKKYPLRHDQQKLSKVLIKII